MIIFSPSEISSPSISDSLSPPLHAPISFSVCQNVIDRMITVSDFQMQKAMIFMAQNCKFILEPAGVATIAALLGPLKDELKNQNTVIVLCGTNIDMVTWTRLTNII